MMEPSAEMHTWVTSFFPFKEDTVSKRSFILGEFFSSSTRTDTAGHAKTAGETPSGNRSLADPTEISVLPADVIARLGALRTSLRFLRQALYYHLTA